MSEVVCIFVLGNLGLWKEVLADAVFNYSHFQTFIYLFAPICSNIRESDFTQNMRLESGKQIWEALWQNRHPDAECFITPVRHDVTG